MTHFKKVQPGYLRIQPLSKFETFAPNSKDTSKTGASHTGGTVICVNFSGVRRADSG